MSGQGLLSEPFSSAQQEAGQVVTPPFGTETGRGVGMVTEKSQDVWTMADQSSGSTALLWSRWIRPQDITAFSLFHSYNGLSVWFPDVIKHLQSDEYASRVKLFRNEEVSNFVFNFTLENQIHSSGEYINDRFVVVLMINKCMYSGKSN